MKNLLTLLLFFVVFSLTAQEKYKSQIGLKFQNISKYQNVRDLYHSVDLIYKKQISEQKVRRFDISLGYQNNSRFKYNDFRLGVKFGIEKHIPISKKNDFIHGAMYEARYAQQNVLDYKSKSFSLGIGYLLGFEWKINDRFNLGISATPTLMKSFGSFGNPTKSVSQFYINPNLAVHATYKFDWRKSKK